MTQAKEKRYRVRWRQVQERTTTSGVYMQAYLAAHNNPLSPAEWQEEDNPLRYFCEQCGKYHPDASVRPL